MAADRPATVGQLLTSPSLSSAELIGGEEGLGTKITEIVLRTVVDKSSAPNAGEIVVLDASTIGEHLYQLDIALRVCADAEAAALILANHSFEIGLGPRRLASRFGLPLLAIDEADTMELVHRLRASLWAADVEQASIINDLMIRIDAMRMSGVDEVVELIAGLSATAVELVGRSHDHIAGTSIDLRGRRLAEAGAYSIDHSLPDALHSTTLVLAPGEEPSYWLLAESNGSDGAQRLLRTMLQIGGWYLTALLATGRVRAESDARRRIAVLNTILDSSEMVERDIHHQLHELGWGAVGWNTGIHIKLRGADAARIVELHAEMRSRLRELDLDGPLVERNDGWSGWVTESTEPAVESYGSMVRRVGEVLESFVGAHSGLVAHAGIGRPHADLEGLRRTLAEAHEAAMIANARTGERSGAAHIDQLGVQRVLMGWFSSDDFARYARSVLDPVIEIDHDDQLLRTLEVYLDCSCSTSDAARQLEIHRNTVANRIRKIGGVLDARLDDPETRLSLQLACRVLRMNR